MMRLSVLIGWVLVIAVGMFSHSNSMSIWLAAITGAASVLLLLDSEFPNRSPALGMSWVGPFLFVSSRAVCVAATSAASASNEIVLSVIVQGFLLALSMVWLWRGYGFVLLLAIPARLVSHDNRASIERAVREYPWRWWWLPPLCMLLLSLGIALDTYHIIHD